MASSNLPSADELRRLFNYDPLTGALTRAIPKHGRSAEQGEVVGILSAGYRLVHVGKHLLRVHRIAWCIVTGDWPENDIDHINLDRADNRWNNLREATRAENTRNQGVRKSNTSGYKGVSWNKEKRKWEAYIKLDRKRIRLGMHLTPELAAKAYEQAAKEYHGDFARSK